MFKTPLNELSSAAHALFKTPAINTFLEQFPMKKEILFDEPGGSFPFPEDIISDENEIDQSVKTQEMVPENPIVKQEESEEQGEDSEEEYQRLLEEEKQIGTTNNINLKHQYRRWISFQGRFISQIHEQVNEKYGPVTFPSEKGVKEEGNLASQGKKYIALQTSDKNTINITLTNQDLSKLLPAIDLNDVIITSYFQLLKEFMLPQETAQKVHVYNTFFVQKLLSQIPDNPEPDVSYLGDQYSESACKMVVSNYHLVKRWTKRYDIFTKKYLVVPINMFHHWFGIIVLNPGVLLNENVPENPSQKCQIIFCDSMFEKRIFIVQAIKQYLILELRDKKGKNLINSKQYFTDYQLLLPRQLNTHDCGLYLLVYVQALLANSWQLQNLESIEKRVKMNLIPRMYLESSRQRIFNLFMGLYQNQNPEGTAKIFEEYVIQQTQALDSSNSGDNFFDESEFDKFIALFNLYDEVEQPELKYQMLLRFHYSGEINYFQVDTSNSPSSQTSSSQ